LQHQYSRRSHSYDDEATVVSCSVDYGYPQVFVLETGQRLWGERVHVGELREHRKKRRAFSLARRLV
jgi:hypothetical protein